nr:probable LRR receptor-like serine/threonine-protein kinase At1g06840 [Malus domestica]
MPGVWSRCVRSVANENCDVARSAAVKAITVGMLGGQVSELVLVHRPRSRGDFGLSRLAPLQDDAGIGPAYVSTIVRGTPGYLDPEYFLTNKLTDKSDVYSLGIVFLELLTGNQPISHGKNIVREVNLAHQAGLVFSIIDSRMGSYPSECVERLLDLALRCCNEKQDKRPHMLEVVRELENILKITPATDTIFSPPTSSYSDQSPTSSSLLTGDRSYVSSSLAGSDLTSGTVPNIVPR